MKEADDLYLLRLIA